MYVRSNNRRRSFHVKSMCLARIFRNTTFCHYLSDMLVFSAQIKNIQQIFLLLLFTENLFIRYRIVVIQSKTAIKITI